MGQMRHCPSQGAWGLGITGLLGQLAKILLGALRVGLHGGSTGRPVGGAHLPVLIGELERLHQSQGFAGKGACGTSQSKNGMMGITRGWEGSW